MIGYLRMVANDEGAYLHENDDGLLFVYSAA